jgi:hypothetical protein
VPGIVRFIAFNFIKPPGGAGFGYYKILAIVMPVPETAMYKNYGFIARQNYIGLAG